MDKLIRPRHNKLYLTFSYYLRAIIALLFQFYIVNNGNMLTGSAGERKYLKRKHNEL